MAKMSNQKVGNNSILFITPPFLSQTGVVIGPKEGEGPLGADADLVCQNLSLQEKSFERAERSLMEEACYITLKKGKLKKEDIDFFLAGDLLNQITVSGFTALSLQIPFLGIYGACTSLAEGLGLAGILLSGGFGSRVLAATSSHNCSAERQYRYPTEYGFQKPGYAQWTATGAGAALIDTEGPGMRITSFTVGEIVDMGITDVFDLGTAMAPAAATVLHSHFTELQREPNYYDLIVTGDLGQVGKQVLEDLLQRKGYNLGQLYDDCGAMLYYQHQQVDAGGSGCACSAIGVLGHLWRRMQKKELNRVLLVATGAMHSPTTSLQGETIPGIAHAVSLEQ